MPNMGVPTHDAWGNPITEIEDDAKRLMQMYPEPGHRETFTKGVMPIKSKMPDPKVSMRSSRLSKSFNENPFTQSQRSIKTRMP